jgi:transcriptional regulator with XRE-family HTH domain
MVKLKRWMDKSQTSQAALARQLVVHRSLVCHWLRGSRKPGRNQLLRLSRTTGIKIEDLL